MKKGDLKNNEVMARCAPAGRRDYVSIQHIKRYRFAVSMIRPQTKVLDIASGSGYGTAMLKRHGCEVIGADYDETALFEARRLWPTNKFIIANALSLPFNDNSFDAVVSFETIEHVHDGKQFLSEMHRVLKPKGTFICSTPNIGLPGPEYVNHQKN